MPECFRKLSARWKGFVYCNWGNVCPVFQDSCIGQQDSNTYAIQIPTAKLFLLNKELDGITGAYGCVYEDFELHILNALCIGIIRIKKYTKLFLIFHIENYYCTGIRDGFVRFCKENGYNFEIIEQAFHHSIKAWELYVVNEETDLVEIDKNSTEKNLILRKTIGIIA